MLLAACLSIPGSAQSSASPAKTRSSPHPIGIVKFFVAPATTGYDTGPLHIVYADGTTSVQRLPPLKKDTPHETFANAVGFAEVHLAKDGRTLGWEILFQNCCTSYSIPESVVVFRDKRVMHEFQQGQMVRSWMFADGGDRIAIVFGTVHGPEVGDYRLYDVSTGKLLSEVWGDEETQALKTDAPEWAKRLEDQLHNKP